MYATMKQPSAEAKKNKILSGVVSPFLSSSLKKPSRKLNEVKQNPASVKLDASGLSNARAVASRGDFQR